MARRSTLKRTFSDSIRLAIDQSGMTRYEISKRTGVEQSALSRFMSGERGLSTSTLDKVAELLNLEVVQRSRTGS